MKNKETIPFWESKTLSEMTTKEWESLCDGCARCCLLKLEDEDNHDIYYTSVCCHLLDLEHCRCTHYSQRSTLVPDCVTLTPDNLHELAWMPSTCAYRLLHEGKPLPEWHPLQSGTSESTRETAASIFSYATPENEIDAEQLPDYIIEWLK